MLIVLAKTYDVKKTDTKHEKIRGSNLSEYHNKLKRGKKEDKAG